MKTAGERESTNVEVIKNYGGPTRRSRSNYGNKEKALAKQAKAVGKESPNHPLSKDKANGKYLGDLTVSNKKRVEHNDARDFADWEFDRADNKMKEDKAVSAYQEREKMKKAMDKNSKTKK